MRAVLLVATVVMLAGPVLAEERVLHCAVSKSTGFIWDEGQAEGRVTNFIPNRYIVKVLSEEERTVTQTTGDFAGEVDTLICRRRYPRNHPERFVCHDGMGENPWFFSGNMFTHAFLRGGTPVGNLDPNIWVNYGTCTEF